MKALHSTTSRIINILELISNNKEGYTLTEVSKLLEIPKTSLSPILKTLAYYNYLAYNEITLKYSIYIGILSVSSSVNKNNAIVKFIKEEMNKIVGSCNEICQLGVLDKDEVLYVEKVNASNPIQLATSVGVQFPANCSALGKALLYKHSFKELKNVFPGELERRTENTITSIKDLYEDIIKIDQNGYATEKEEGMKEVECIAVPIIKDNLVLAAISVSIPLFRSSQKKKDKVIDLLTESRKKVEKYISNMNVKSIFD
ncbi:transcriptional regulator, IclR family [Arcobacter nitrofigilis DSM 7299]|uniref:Transcriptional regulator, IclR family n=1 Tax=Arcobacter nitrofigilis (strain ATCC 33309 / DSM 7299 / CCUG 15893 / LMG 7604 / NCTC 12251 / CI) TaxID=572480 RepID=D5V3H3_ARCNC|nr:IclR family transcriptional regulator [Arcobacter nitrofigilis]ADG91684.1 transcriptional regulator, IclR family [Arcobacter nitrofigilis DSM 7299]